MGPKRRKLSITEKVEIIREIENNKHLPATEVARKFDLARSTLYGILKMKETILAEEMKMGDRAKNRRSMKNSPYDELESVLYSWFQSNRNSTPPINGFILREKAVSIAQSLNLDKFKASNGWMTRFKIRHGLMHKNEKVIDDRILNSWKGNSLMSTEFVSCDVDVNMATYSEDMEEICSDTEVKDDSEVEAEKEDELDEQEVSKEKANNVDIQEIGRDKLNEVVKERLNNEHIPTFEEAIASFEVVRKYITSAVRDSACLMRLSMLELDILNIHRTMK